MLKELAENPRYPVLRSDAPMTPAQLDDYADALDEDPIKGCRELVGTCRASGQRRHDLMQVIVQGNQQKDWQTEDGTLRELQLLRDCETRWSSTHNMGDRVLELYQASI